MPLLKEGCTIQDGGKACGKEHNHFSHGTNIKLVKALKQSRQRDTRSSHVERELYSTRRMAKVVGEDQMSCGENNLKSVDNFGDVLLKFEDISVKGGDT